MASARLLLCLSGSGSRLPGVGSLLMAMVGVGVGAGAALEQVEGRGAGWINVAAASFWLSGCQRSCVNRDSKHVDVWKDEDEPRTISKSTNKPARSE